MKNAKERVIFRKAYDTYMKIWKYRCIFPDDEANIGMVCVVDIWKNGNRWFHDCYGEMNMFYVMKNKIIHKTNPIVGELLCVLKDFYGNEFEAVEKIMRRK